MRSTSVDPSMEPLVEAKQIATFLGIAPLTVLRYARSRKLPSYEFPYGQTKKVQYKFRMSEVESYVRTLARPCEGASSNLSRAANG